MRKEVVEDFLHKIANEPASTLNIMSAMTVIQQLQAEIESFQAPTGGVYSEEYTEYTGWGTEHEASRYRHIHKEVEEMGGWANYRHFMRVKRYQDRKMVNEYEKNMKKANDRIEELEYKLNVALTNGLTYEDIALPEGWGK